MKTIGISGEFIYLAMPCSMWDLSSLTKDRTSAQAVEARALSTGPPGESLGGFTLSYIFMRL